MLRFTLVSTFVLAGCFAYRPGSLLRRPRGWPVPRGYTFGCIDVNAAPHAETTRPSWSVVLQIGFGNRCRYPVAIDPSAMTITGWYPSGDVTTGILSDPRQEIHRVLLDGSDVALLNFEFEPNVLPDATSPAVVCVDLSHVAPDAIGSTPAPVCFERRGTQYAYAPRTTVGEPVTR